MEALNFLKSNIKPDMSLLSKAFEVCKNKDIEKIDIWMEET